MGQARALVDAWHRQPRGLIGSVGDGVALSHERKVAQQRGNNAGDENDDDERHSKGEEPHRHQHGRNAGVQNDCFAPRQRLNRHEGG